ncbi:MAG TPA: hypothetical protein VFL86_15340, partial [Burkholderiaceae bacterium]|nr:hypothetical protein [Burkholderiaceae bacterium]
MVSNSGAQQLWGDASLWYLIAEANGLSGMEQLSEGQLLLVPRQVTNLHNNSQVLRRYNPAEAIGTVDPTVPPHSDRCGTLSQIIGAVAAAVAYVYGGPAGPYIAGAVGNVAQQYSNAAFNGELDYCDLFKRGLPLAYLSQVAPGLAARYLVENRKHPPGFVRGLAYDYKGTGIAIVAGAVSGGVGSLLSGAPDFVRAGASTF